MKDTRPLITPAQREELVKSAKQLAIEDLIAMLSLFSLLATDRCKTLGIDDSDLYTLVVTVNTVVNDFILSNGGTRIIVEKETT